MTVRMRHTRSHTNNRRSHHALAKPTLTVEAGSVHMRHRMSPTTGMYRGRKVVDMAAKATRKAEKSKDNAR